MTGFWGVQTVAQQQEQVLIVDLRQVVLLYNMLRWFGPDRLLAMQHTLLQDIKLVVQKQDLQ